MLVLSRKILEQTFIDVPPSDVWRRIVVSVADIDRGKVRLGFQADNEVKIVRQELLPPHQQQAFTERKAS